MTEVREWYGPTIMLRDALMADAMKEPNRWHARQIPSGPLVAFRWDRPEGEPIGSYTIRVAVKTASSGFEQTVDKLAEAMNLTDEAWRREAEGERAVRFIERAGEGHEE